MALDPIFTFKQLNKSYKKFLDAQFTFRDDCINDSAKNALSQECELLNGPYIEAHMPYKGTNTLQDLVNQGVLNKNIYKAFTKEEFSIYKRYNHQEKATKMVNNNQSIIVASGTGSGKTECFFIPIINALLNELDAGTLGHGVRALIIYPMNALANDQMARLRESLKNLPEITFGRYIGETPNGLKQNIAKGRKDVLDEIIKNDDYVPLDNELLTRAEMENSPPHILVTNYAMLEYMLLRASSQKIFNGEYSDNFKFLVLDEAHTYKGAHGTEVAMLIRRLKETIFGRIDNCLTCIGTSATLGGGEEEIQKVVDFAKDLFCENFTRDSIICSDRKTLEKIEAEYNSEDYYLELYNYYHNYTNIDKPQQLYNKLSKDRLVYEIRKKIIESTITITELAKYLQDYCGLSFNNMENIITHMIELCGEAISPVDGLPLINAKYHVFARTLEGGFITFADKIKVFTERRKEYNGNKVYELFNCMKCGQEYIGGEIVTYCGEDYLLPNEDNVDLFMLSNSDSIISIDEDDSENIVENSIELLNKDWFLLCPTCGKLFPYNCSNSITCCNHKKEHFISLIKVEHKNKNTCYNCGKFNKGTIRRLTTSEDSAIEMLTRQLYQLLPAEKKKNTVQEEDSIWGNDTSTDLTVESGRKLLVFSDNRQEAARFAIFIQNRYNDWLWKKIIYNEVATMQEETISFKRLVERCYKVADANKLFYNEKTTDEKQDFAKKQIMKEVIELEPRMSLNRLGLIDIAIDNVHNISNKIIESFISNYNMTREEFLEIVDFLFDSLRRQGCVSFPEGVDQTDDSFEPKNYETFFKIQGGEKEYTRQFFGFIPSQNRTNKRHDFIKKFYMKKGYSTELASQKAIAFLEDFSKAFSKGYFSDQLPIITNVNIDKKGIYHKLNLENIMFKKRNRPIYVCKSCGETIYGHLGICGKTNCNGEVVEILNNEDRGQYYRDSFTSIEIIPMNAQEHTAQLSSKEATSKGKSFKDNNINLLSCSTTFEMGVDIGSLEAVVLRNVPPETSNYIQRAGRAGRRGSSAAFILTFAKRRSHDLTYYADPKKMINGIIKAPYIELNNAYLVRRHMHSIVFSYLSKRGYSLHTASDLLGKENQQSINNIVYQLLNEERPIDLFNSINTVVPDSIKKELGVNANWSFSKFLVDEDESNEFASLDNAINNLVSTISNLSRVKEEYYKNEQGRDGDRIKKVITTYEEKDYISTLAESNVLPRYGFPVYTVPLELNTENVLKGSLELQRDLRMAITEYAPGAQVVANGKYWKPYALKKEADRGWPTYDFAICDKCSKKYFYKTALGVQVQDRDISCCGHTLHYKQVLIPQFGFITKRTDKESRKMREENHYHSTLMFEGFLDNKQVENNQIEINGKSIIVQYSPNGEMFAINGGTHVRREKLIGMPFYICEICGFVNTPDTHVKRDSEHRTSTNTKCSGRLLPAFLGHYFKSDALVIKLPVNNIVQANQESILYAIIEGACKYMEIDRREIGGAIWSNGDNKHINITLFDTIPNGAGHVKRMQPYLKNIFNEALEKVNGTCGCGVETCCYGCLRNYDNQIYHDIMSRGVAKEYLSWLLKE